MKRLMTASVLTALLFATLLAAGCGSAPLESGWQESGGRNDWSASFGAFNGSRTHVLGAEDGRWVDVDYDMRVEEGYATLLLRGPDGEVVWEITGDGEQSDSVQVPLPDPGQYTFAIYADGATGGFDLSWDVR